MMPERWSTSMANKRLAPVPKKELDKVVILSYISSHYGVYMNERLKVVMVHGQVQCLSFLDKKFQQTIFQYADDASLIIKYRTKMWIIFLKFWKTWTFPLD